MSPTPLRATFVTGLSGIFTLIASPSLALTLGFYSISNNDWTDVSIALSQITVDVSDAGNGQVLFLFKNSGPEASSITDVYFADGAVLGGSFIDDAHPGVDFDYGASPANLPGGDGLSSPFLATQSFSSTSPRTPNGVGPGEWLGLLFDLQPGAELYDVLHDLETADLRIGLKVQGFASDGSESLVNRPIPEPGTMIGLATFGIAVVAGRRWRARQLHAV